jgi:hypothetical protein
MLPSPLFLCCTKVCKTLVLKGQKTHLFQVRKIDSPTASKVPVEPIGKEIAQYLFRVVLCGKLQCGIDGIVPERQIQDLKYRMAEFVVGEPN